MKAFFLKCIGSIESAPLSISSWIITFSSLVLLRYLIELTLVRYVDITNQGIFFTLSHYWLEFFFVAMLFILITRFAGKTDIKKASNFTLFGFLLILTPPISDYIIFHNPGIFSLYEFGSLRELVYHFFTFFDDTPDFGITYGIRIEIAIAIVIMALYSYFKTEQLWRVFMTAFLTYMMLYVVSTLPSWITFFLLIGEKNLLSINSLDAVQIFLSPTLLFGTTPELVNASHLKMSLTYIILDLIALIALLFLYFRSILTALYHNARLPQMGYHAGLFLLGALIVPFFESTTFRFDFFHILAVLTMLIAVECAWLASVVVNDLYDIEIDKVTNRTRPLIANTIAKKDYSIFGILFFFISIFFMAIISVTGALLLVAYQAIAFLYSANPLRLKRFPLFATLFASAASLLIFFAGYIIFSTIKSINSMPWSIPAFLFVAYTFLLTIKDFKDITGDKHDQVYTIPVLLGAQLGKQVIGTLTFLLFVFSPFVLHIRSLFFPALFFGGLTFLALQKGTDDETSFFAFRKLPRIILTLTILYGIVTMLFLM